MLLVIRLILTIQWIAFTAICGIIAGLLRPFNPNNATFAARLFQLGHHILGIKMSIRHREILEQNRPCIFVSNHQSNLDIFVGSFSIPPRTVSMGKKSLIYIPFFGIFYWLSGNILIDRKNKKKAFGAMDEVVKAIKDKNISVWIMPEGTRSKGLGLLPFKKGPFVTAIKAGIPIVPVAVNNYYGKMNFNHWHAGDILIEALPPIFTHDLQVEDAVAVKDKIFHQLQEAIYRLDRELVKEKEQNKIKNE